MARSSVRLLFIPSVIVGVAFCALLGLGAWQVRRLTWKETLIAQIEARASKPPEPIPPENDWEKLNPDQYNYAHVVAKGVFLSNVNARLFRASAPEKAGGGDGAGYFIITPLRLDNGAIVLVNRGFLPLRRVEEAAQAPVGETKIIGLVRPPETRNAFTPADEPAKGLWYTRDAVSIANAYQLTRIAPFIIDEDFDPAAKQWPRGGATEVKIANNHLAYALTWFGLALALLAVFLIWARGTIRDHKSAIN